MNFYFYPIFGVQIQRSSRWFSKKHELQRASRLAVLRFDLFGEHFLSVSRLTEKGVILVFLSVIA